MSFDDVIRQTVRDVIREELRAALAELRPAAPSEYLPVAEAARLASVAPDTIRLWVKEGRLPRHNAGRELRIRRDELDRFLESGQNGAEQTPEEVAVAILERRRRTA